MISGGVQGALPAIHCPFLRGKFFPIITHRGKGLSTVSPRHASAALLPGTGSRSAGLQDRDAHVFTKLIVEMASTNLIHRFESKLEAQNAKLDAQTEALNSKLRFIQWTIGLCF